MAGGATTRFTPDTNRKLPVLLDDGNRLYVWGLGSKRMCSIKRSNTADVWVYHRDGVGSVRAVTDANQNLGESGRTSAYGDHVVEAGAAVVQVRCRPSRPNWEP